MTQRAIAEGLGENSVFSFQFSVFRVQGAVFMAQGAWESLVLVFGK
jgi:hypothetical protein